MSTAPIDDVQGEIYLSLCMQVGHLFLSFANVEGVLSTVLKLHMAETISADESNPTAIKLAGAVYGSMRFKESRDTIKRVAATQKHDKDSLDFLSAVFAQIGHIQAFRDMLAHQSLQRANERIDGTWRLSNLFTTKDVTKLPVYEFGLNAVGAASSDLGLGPINRIHNALGM